MRYTQREKLRKVKEQLWKNRNDLEEIGSEIWEDGEKLDEGIPQLVESAVAGLDKSLDTIRDILEE